jgi:hypothetical protein
MGMEAAAVRGGDLTASGRASTASRTRLVLRDTEGRFTFILPLCTAARRVAKKFATFPADVGVHACF